MTEQERADQWFRGLSIGRRLYIVGEFFVYGWVITMAKVLIDHWVLYTWQHEHAAQAQGDGE